MQIATHGILAASASAVAPSFSNTKSLVFDGVDDFVNMSNVLNLANDGSDAVSISLWLKTSLSSLGYLVSKQTGFTDGYAVFMLPTGAICFYLGSSGSSARIYACTQNTFNNGNWHNIVVTYDGSQDVSGLNIYVNNTLQTLTVATNNTPNNVSNSGSFTIGMRNGTAYPYLGTIDEVAVWTSELSASNVTSIYNSGSPADLTSLSPVSWWRNGDGDTFPTLTDNGSGSNNGTMTNMTSGDIVTDVP